MAGDALSRLRALVPGPIVAHGRPLLVGLEAAPWKPGVRLADPTAAGVIWGLPGQEALSALLASLPPGARVACVTPVRRGGARGALDRVLLVGSRHAPVLLEDVCTRLFVSGVGGLGVFEIDARRNVVAVVGRKPP